MHPRLPTCPLPSLNGHAHLLAHILRTDHGGSWELLIRDERVACAPVTIMQGAWRWVRWGPVPAPIRARGCVALLLALLRLCDGGRQVQFALAVPDDQPCVCITFWCNLLLHLMSGATGGLGPWAAPILAPRRFCMTEDVVRDVVRRFHESAGCAW